MPTRKDNTNVAPIHREQVFIPAVGYRKIIQNARPKINGLPVASGAIEIVSPEFDLLTGIRGIANMVRPKNVYASVGNETGLTMFDGATTTQEAVKQGIKEARDYVRHPVVQETVEHNRRLSERIFGEKAKNMGWWEDGTKRVTANNRGEVLQHYVDRPVNIKNTTELPKGWLGDYNSAIPRIRFKSGMTPYDTKRTVFHEGLHHSGFGNFEGGLYDLKAEKLFDIDDYLRGHEAAVHTAELGRIMGLELGQKYPGLQAFKDMITKYNVPKYDKTFIFDKAILNTPRDYKRLWDALTGKYFTTAGAVGTGAALTTNDKMKCGGRRKAQLGLDIREGGIAIPIASNMYYMKGRSHDNGGIAIGPNNKNGLEVEGGEVVKVGKNDVKVFSSVPLLRGVSPAQLVMGGANPNKVFKAQEEFKDRNRINDDGTTYQTGGKKKSNSAIRTEADKKVPVYNRAVYSLVDPTMGYPTKKEALGYAIGAGIKAMRNPNDMVYWVTDSVSDAAWRKRHGLSYDNKFLIPNEDGSVRLPKDREMEIPTDTTMLKNRIAANKKLAKRYPEGSEKRDIVDWALKVDGMALDSLRHTYKTGEPVTINEGAYNSRRLINNGELNYPEIMPHNVMQNYAIQYDKSKHKMNYWDTYNFNEFEWGVPGKPFDIRGSVPLKRYGGSTQDDTKTAALKRLRNKFTIRGNYDGGLFGGAGAGSIIMKQPEFINDTITKRYLVPVTQNFNDAFGNAVNAGLDKFMFNKKWYTTEKGNNPNNNAAGATRTQTIYLPVEHKEVRRRKKEFGGNMIYEINGNVKNGLMGLRPKGQYGLATKYLKKKNNTSKVETVKTKETNEISNNFSINPNIAKKIGLLTLGTVGTVGLGGATAYGLNQFENYVKNIAQPYLEISQDALNKYNENYVRKTQGKTTKGFTPRNPLRNSNNLQYRRLNINEANIGLYDSKDPIVRATVRARGLNPKRVTADGSIVRGSSNLSAAEQRKLDKDYRKVVGNKEPKSGFGAKPANKVITVEYPNTSINSKPVNVVGKTYDPTVEFKQANKPKPKPNPGLNNYLKKVTRGVKGLGVIGSLLDIYNNLFPSEEVETLENLRVRMNKINKDLTSRSQTKYGGRIKAEGGKFLKYKNGVFTDPKTGEQFDVDPEVFKMYGNTFEEGVIPTADYTKGTFDNARPQFYAEKRIGLFGDKSLAEKAGLARSGWSYGSAPTINYMPDINLSIPENYGKGVKRQTNSTPRKEDIQVKSISNVNNNIPTITSKLKSGDSTYDVSQLGSPKTKAAKAKLNTSSTGGGTQPKDGRWVGQYKATNAGDWIGLGSNVLGSLASYFITKNAINKMPDPVKPVMAQAAKLKTRYNIEPQLTNVREAEQINRATVRRNTQSSNTSLAREQRLMNEARGVKNQLYGQKENIETQLINQDRLNRQSVRMNNVRTYNDYLNRLIATRQTQNQLGVNNINNLIYGLTGSVNNILGTIESRRATNNTLRAIAAANPNVDARLIGGFDYYIDPVTKRKYNKNQQYIGTING